MKLIYRGSKVQIFYYNNPPSPCKLVALIFSKPKTNSDQKETNYISSWIILLPVDSPLPWREQGNGNQHYPPLFLLFQTHNFFLGVQFYNQFMT